MVEGVWTHADDLERRVLRNAYAYKTLVRISLSELERREGIKLL